MFAGGMWIFYLESALALSMFVFIVWWTLPKKPKDKSGKSAEAGDPAARGKEDASASDVRSNAGGESKKSNNRD